MISLKTFITLLFIAEATYSFLDAIYRILYEKDIETPWKVRAITNLISAIIYIALLYWIGKEWGV